MGQNKVVSLFKGEMLQSSIGFEDTVGNISKKGNI